MDRHTYVFVFVWFYTLCLVSTTESCGSTYDQITPFVHLPTQSPTNRMNLYTNIRMYIRTYVHMYVGVHTVRTYV